MSPKKPTMQPLARAAKPASKKSTASSFRDSNDKVGFAPLARAADLARKKNAEKISKESAKKGMRPPLARAVMPARKKSVPAPTNTQAMMKKGGCVKKYARGGGI